MRRLVASGLPNTQTCIQNHPNELSEATFFISHNWQKDEPFLVARRSHRGCPAFTLDLHHQTTEGGLPFRAAPTLKLTDAKKANRVLFAEMPRKPPGFWTEAMFSDEMVFRTDKAGKLC